LGVTVGEIRFDAQGREDSPARARRGRARGLDAGLVAIAVVCLGAVGAALVTQYRYGMDPCPWCVLQRAIFVALALAALLGLVWRRVSGRVVSGVLVLLLALSGVAAALWQHFVAASSSSCNLTLADRIMSASKLPTLLPDVFEARATCADAAVSLFGVAYDLWSCALFVLVAIAALLVLRAVGRR
jgi:disulfide bond formation protein DsbB